MKWGSCVAAFGANQVLANQAESAYIEVVIRVLEIFKT